MSKTLIKDATIVNEGQSSIGSVLINDGKIAHIYKGATEIEADHIIDAKGLHLLPGIIDDQVHFRDPGLTHKGDIHSESRAAAAGGVTSFMEMPNTNPQTTSFEALEEKFQKASENSLVNYSFYFGATNDNTHLISKIDPKKVCGVKVFMGSSTGNMLVDKEESLKRIFSESPVLVATHCEDEGIIQANTSKFKEEFGQDMPFRYHPKLRSEEACYKSSSFAVELAKKYNARLHILHLSTAKELELFDNSIPLKEKKITAEVCVHHLWFNDTDYDEHGARIKWNPAVKTKNDQDGLLKGLLEDKIDVIATDHAPHTLKEKSNTYFKAPSGGPLVQHSLLAMLDLMQQGKISIEEVVRKMCHAPADLFQVEKRGYLKEGYWADLVLVDLNKKHQVTKDNILYKCAWSPFEGHQFQSSIEKTFVNGEIVFDDGALIETRAARALTFMR